MNINNFKSNTRGHMARASHFDMLITPPSILGFSTARDLQFKISATNLPGKSVQTTEYKFHGPLRKIPYSYIANDVTLTVLCSDNYSERNFFMSWQEAAHGLNTRNRFGYFDGNEKKVNYYSELIGTADIFTYNLDGNKSNQVTLHEAYPINVNETTLGWDQGGTISTFTVQLNYYMFTEQTISRPAGTQAQASPRIIEV